MHSIGFERLVKKMDEISLRIKEKIIIQIGNTNYIPKNTTYFRFKSYSEIQRLCRNARVIVAHGGTGSVITAFEQKTPIIVIPRLKDYGEVIDSQQIDFVNALAEEGRVIPVYDLNELENTLKNKEFSLSEQKNDRMLTNALQNYIVRLSE